MASSKVESDVDVKVEATDSIDEDKQRTGSKKKSRSKEGRRRTKTGCLTCRQRRVKCDEAKPTCRNCDKSRRNCAGYQPTVVRHPSHISDQSFEQCIGQFPPGSPMPVSGGGYSVMHGHYQSPPQDYMQHHVVHHPSPQYAHRPEMWPGANQYYNYAQSGHWSPGQESYNSSVASTQPYPYEMHAANVPTMHMAPMSAYPGMPNSVSQVPQSKVRPDMSRSTSSISAFSDAFGTKADSGKSSSRQGGSQAEHIETIKSLKRPRNDPSHNDLQIPKHRMYSGPQHAVEEHETEEDPNDPWDIDSDDEIEDVASLIPSRPSQRLILDERMAYLMSHFCNYLRPCISLWEPPVTFNGSSTLAEKVPALSLSCRGLLHGLMAVSALHLAILHRTSEMIPLKHFVIAQNKLTRLIKIPSQRHRVETLALCLLLAYYSVILGDHSKWVMHMKGCSSFLMEHDFAAFQRFLWELKKRKKENERLGRLGSTASPFETEWSLDEDLVHRLTGLEISYGQHFQSVSHQSQLKIQSQADVDDWRARLDLMAWFLKMDMFQAMLSGDGLLLPFRSWKFFTPRGTIGNVDSVHATMDHLLLVLGRLADFGARDRARKQRRVAENGGDWRPEPGFLAQPRPPARFNEAAPTTVSANESRARSASKSTPFKGEHVKRPSLFYGMVPPTRIPPSMLSSFHVADRDLQSQAQTDISSAAEETHESTTSATEKALKEHALIAEALDTWRSSLSEAFELQSFESEQSPFGTYLRHTDPTIACLSSFYYLARILLRRYHPHSPPAMMMSASVNAFHTQRDAVIIGQIFAGLLDTQNDMAKAGSINPTLVATLQELTFPIMFAGVQYTDPGVRAWMIDKLVSVGEESGWKTAFSVASALEAAWAAHGGYEKTLPSRNPQDAKRYDPKTTSEGDIGSSQAEWHARRFDSHDRRLLDRFSDLRAFWAVGVLSTPNDVATILADLKVDD